MPANSLTFLPAELFFLQVTPFPAPPHRPGSLHTLPAHLLLLNLEELQITLVFFFLLLFAPFGQHCGFCSDASIISHSPSTLLRNPRAQWKLNQVPALSRSSFTSRSPAASRQGLDAMLEEAGQGPTPEAGAGEEA